MIQLHFNTKKLKNGTIIILQWLCISIFRDMDVTDSGKPSVNLHVTVVLSL